MMNSIKLVDDVRVLEGTCYFEFLPGIYTESCWNKESVFIRDLHIMYVEPILEKHIDNYDHYSFMSVDKVIWHDIIEELNEFKEVLRNSSDLNQLSSGLEFSFRDFEENFIKDFDTSRKELMRMIDEFVLWLRQTLKDNNKISILGM